MLVKTPEATITAKNSKHQSFYHWFVLIILFSFVLFGGTVSAIMPAYLPDVCRSLTDSVSSVQRIAMWLNASYFSGLILGAASCQLTGYRIGYKRVIVFAVFCYSFFTILASTSFTWQWVVACRFISGFGVGSMLVAVVFFMALSWQVRSVVHQLVVVAFSFGVFLAGVITLTVTDWKEAFMGGIVPLILSTIALWRLREPEKIEAAAKEELKIFSNGQRHKILIAVVVFLILLSWLPTWELNLLKTTYQRGLTLVLAGAGALVVTIIVACKVRP